MTAKFVPIQAPVTAIGAGVTEALKAGLFRIKGPAIGYDATGVLELFKVPAGTFVHEVVLEVTAAWDATGTPTFTIGDSDDVDRFMLSAISLLKTVGSKSCKTGTAVGSGGHLYTADALITASYADGSGTGSSSGAAVPYLIFSQYGELL